MVMDKWTNMQHWWNETYSGKPKHLEKKFFQYHHVYYKSHMNGMDEISYIQIIILNNKLQPGLKFRFSKFAMTCLKNVCNSMEQSLLQKVMLIHLIMIVLPSLWNLEVYYHIHTHTQWLNPITVLRLYLFKNTCPLPIPNSQIHSVFLTTILNEFFSLHVLSTTSFLIRSPSGFFLLHITMSLLSPNIFLSTMFLNTINHKLYCLLENDGM